MTILGWICYLIIAAVCAWIAEAVVPGTVPGGFLVSMVIGIIGAWIGGHLMGNFGPTLAHIALIPCILGSAILVFCIALISGLGGRRYYVS